MTIVVILRVAALVLVSRLIHTYGADSVDVIVVPPLTEEECEQFIPGIDNGWLYTISGEYGRFRTLDRSRVREFSRRHLRAGRASR